MVQSLYLIQKENILIFILKAYGHIGGLFLIHSLLFAQPVFIEVGQTFAFYQVCVRALEVNKWPFLACEVKLFCFDWPLLFKSV